MTKKIIKFHHVENNEKTVISCQETGLMIRLIFVLQERGNSCDQYNNNSIIVDSMLTVEYLQNIIDEQFNPDVIKLENSK